MTAINSNDLLSRLRAKYQAPEYAFFAEVASGTGSASKTRADALAFNLWPSRGLALSGFEIKCHRADWLMEMRHPAKADEIARFCEYWYLVIADPAVIQPGELPDGWGLMIPWRSGLRIMTEARRSNSVESWTRQFMISIVRRAAEAGDREYNQAMRSAEDRGFKRGKDHGANYEIKRAARIAEERDKLQKAVQTLQEVAGIDLMDRSWMIDWPKDIAEAVKFVREGGIDSMQKELGRIRQMAEKIIKTTDGI